MNREVWQLPVFGDPILLVYLNTEARPGWDFRVKEREAGLGLEAGTWLRGEERGLLLTWILTERGLM